MIYLVLIFEFFKIGLFAIGGGLATIPFLYDLSEKHGWYTTAELADMIALSESTPGPIGVNMATYAGFKAAGTFGGIAATLSLVCPSIIIIVIVSHFILKFRSNKMVDNVFYGLRPASAGLIAAAMFGVLASSVYSAESGINFAAAGLYLLFTAFCFFARNRKAIHPIMIIALGAVIGILLGDYL